MRLPSNQGGAYLVLTAILLVVLLGGMGGLVVDVGRLTLLRSEMQNAVDAAALAAATELDGGEYAQTRAKQAVTKALLEHFTGIVNDEDEQQLLKGISDTDFTFYCSIGSKIGDEDLVPSVHCSDSPDPLDGNKTPASSSEDSHFVRVKMDPDSLGFYEIDLLFLPVLKAIGIDTPDIASLGASALAGRTFFPCNYPPMMICDPLEDSDTGTFREQFNDGKISEGAVFRLVEKGGGGAWAPGEFGYLDMPTEPDQHATLGETADALATFNTEDSKQECTLPEVSIRTGGPSRLLDAINTRFGIASAQYDGDNADWPAAGITDSFELTIPPGLRYEEGLIVANSEATPWENSTEDGKHYFCGGAPNDAYDKCMAATTRWEAYAARLEAEHKPVNSQTDRRVIYAALLSCDALGLHGNFDNIPIAYPDGFVKFFITNCIKKNPSPDNDDCRVLMREQEENTDWTDYPEYTDGQFSDAGNIREVFAEFFEFVGEDDPLYRIEVQLYE